VDQHWPIEPLVRFPNLLELVIGERGMLVVANWNMHDLKSVNVIVRNQIHPKPLGRAATVAGPADK
jgi:hypothetical protein